MVAVAVREGFARTTAKGLALGGAFIASAGLIFVVLQWIGGVSPPLLMGEFMQLPYLGETLRLRAMTESEAMLACVLTAATPFAITFCRSDRVRSWCAFTIAMIAAAGLTFSHAIAGFAVAVLISAWPSFAGFPRLGRVAVAGVVLICLVLILRRPFQSSRYRTATPVTRMRRRFTMRSIRARHASAAQPSPIT